MTKKLMSCCFVILTVLNIAAQNVGIGTTTPAYKLDVTGTTRFTGDHILTNNNIGGTWFYLTNTSSTPTGWKLITSGSASAAPLGTLMLFNDNNLPRFAINQNGNTGIGTASPQTRLHITDANFPTALIESSSTIGTWVGLKNTSAGGIEWNIISTGSGNGEGAGRLLFYNQGATALNISNSLVTFGGNINVPGGRYYFNDRYFLTNAYVDDVGQPNGIAIAPHAGNFGGLGASGFYWDDAHITEIRYNDLIDVSDERAKMNIRPLETVMDKIQKLQPVRFDINPATHPGYKNARPEEIEIAKGTMGFTAQNLKEVFPSMVIYDKELDIYTVRNYHQLLSVLVQALKEQQTINTSLEARIKVLESR